MTKSDISSKCPMAAMYFKRLAREYCGSHPHFGEDGIGGGEKLSGRMSGRKRSSKRCSELTLLVRQRDLKPLISCIDAGVCNSIAHREMLSQVTGISYHGRGRGFESRRPRHSFPILLFEIAESSNTRPGL